MSTLSIQNIAKRFKEIDAVKNITLEIHSGEFFSVLGPSGCGKTTLLRLVAGFEKPSSGRILIDGSDVTDIPPQSRGIGMVFQNYALFPHMTVFENVAFGLEAKKVPKQQIRAAVERILNAVDLHHKMETPVPNLSGGEQQRVAVARALVIEPAVLLFDEPLSNLDVALREKTREEIRQLQRKTGITTMYVTHDQSEAMSLSDRIAVMRSGRFEQVGSPSEIYEAPDSSFVAQFLGGANILNGTLAPSGRLVIGDLHLTMPPRAEGSNLGEVTVAVKPEAITLLPVQQSDHGEAQIEEKQYLGFTTHFVIRANDVTLRVAALSSDFTKRLTIGDSVGFRVEWSGCSMFARE